MAAPVSAENKAIGKHILSVFGGKPQVWTYADEKEENKIDILSCPDRPAAGLVSYSTIGLSDANTGLTVEDKPLGLELAGVCAAHYPQFGNILSTCAFNIMQMEKPPYPGLIVEGVVEMYLPASAMKHLLLVPPFAWQPSFATLEFPTKKVTWLMAVPISEAEYYFAQERGVEDLSSLLEQKQVDVNDLERASVL